MRNIKKYLKQNFLFLTKTYFFCILLVYFSFILVFSTIIQKEIHIDSVFQKYIYSNFIYIMDFIPIPGGKIILTLITFNLFLKIINEKFINNKKIGTSLIHLGIIILFFGGFLTTNFSKEGSILLENQKIKKKFTLKNKFVLKIKNENNEKFLIQKENIYKKNEFNLKFISLYDNSEILPKKFLINNSENENNIINYFNIKKIPMFIENEKNQTIALIYVFNKNNKFYFYLLKDKIEKIFLNNTQILISLKEMKEKLPFSIKLIKASKINYINSEQTKLYESKILIKDENMEKIFDIKMNKPVNYKGYTFYQTSFIEDQFGKNKIRLMITKDYGKIFPYISCLVVFLGFLIHFIKILRYKND